MLRSGTRWKKQASGLPIHRPRSPRFFRKRASPDFLVTSLFPERFARHHRERVNDEQKNSPARWSSLARGKRRGRRIFVCQLRGGYGDVAVRKRGAAHRQIPAETSDDRIDQPAAAAGNAVRG